MARIRVKNKLTGQTGTLESSDFNPQTYEMLDQPTETQTEPNPGLASRIGQGVLNIGKAVVQPVTRFGGGIGSAGESLVDARLQEKTAQSINEQMQLNQSKAQQLLSQGNKEGATRLLDLNAKLGEQLMGVSAAQQKTGEQMTKAEEDTLKGAVGTGAIFLPGGLTPTTLAGRAVPGLTSSALTRLAASTLAGAGAGYGVSEEGEELQSIVGGGVLGLGVGAGAELLGAGGRALAARRAGKIVEKDKALPTITGSKLKKDVYFAGNKEEMGQLAKDIGITDKMKSGNKTELIYQAAQDFNEVADDVVLNAPPRNPETVKQSVTSAIDEFKPNQKSTEWQRWWKRLADASDNESLWNIKQDAGKKIGNNLNKPLQEIPEGKRPAAVMYRAIKDVFPELKNINRKQFVLSRLASEFGADAAKFENLRIGVRVPGTTRGIITPVKAEAADLASEGLFATIIRGIASPKIGAEAAGIAAGESPQIVRNIVAQSLISPNQTQQPTDTIASPTSPAAIALRQQQTRTTGGMPPEVLAQARLQLSDTEFDKLLAYNQFLQTGMIGADTTAATQKRQLLLQQAAPVVAQIVEASEKAPTGLTGSLLATVGKVPGVTGGEAEYLSRDIEGYARLIANVFASEVGVATDKDVERWKNLMPRPGDTKTERQRQANMLINRIQTEAQSLNIPVPTEIVNAAAMMAQ